jgi:hypothetical protein
MIDLGSTSSSLAGPWGTVASMAGAVDNRLPHLRRSNRHLSERVAAVMHYQRRKHGAGLRMRTPDRNDDEQQSYRDLTQR